MKNNYLILQSVFKGSFLTFFLTLFSSTVQAQSDYSVAAIPYQVYSATSVALTTQDDLLSPPISLGFDFDFYGTIYNQVNVSTNGYIGFTPPQAGNNNSPWAFTQTIPNATFPVKNAFLGCYHDMNNSNAEGTITYSLIGSSPYRKMVVLFDNHSHFSCSDLKSTFQMILYETLNIMDVQIVDKQLCLTWNNGNAVTGILNQTGLLAITPPNRNTSAWAAFNEGWRFQRPFSTTNYLFAKCDDDTDGFITFNLQVAQNDLYLANPLLVSFYGNELDAINQTNAFTNLNYTNISVNTETIYANVNGEVKTVILRVVDCENDYDLDSVATADEDLNSDTNLANDDTDFDGIPNFIDNDDDGDMVLTSVEYVFGRSAASSLAFLDTDTDGILNYLDNDDDEDGILTIDEDYNNNNNPSDDDTNANSIPDYLENLVALGLAQLSVRNEVVLYPNPASTILNVENKSDKTISSLIIFNINGAKVKEFNTVATFQTIPISDLTSGIYLIKMVLNNEVLNYKFIKK